MISEGKTIRRVETAPTGEYGKDESTVLIHFTDGTALRISGHSYEEVDQSVGEIDAAEVRAYARRAAGRREEERLRRLRDEELRSISCEERTARKAARKTTGMFIPDALGEALMDSFIRDMHRGNSFLGLDEPTTFKGACKHCGERWCPNAPDLPVRDDRGMFCVAGEITIPVRRDA